jgi:hypothetical protein
LTLVKTTRADSGERVLTQSSLLVSILGILTHFGVGMSGKVTCPQAVSRESHRTGNNNEYTNTSRHLLHSVGRSDGCPSGFMVLQAATLHRRYHARQALSLMSTASGSVDWNCRLCLCQASSSSRPASPSLTASVQRLGPAATERRVRRIHSL